MAKPHLSRRINPEYNVHGFALPLEFKVNVAKILQLVELEVERRMKTRPITI
jgi:hypothetical protein